MNPTPTDRTPDTVFINPGEVYFGNTAKSVKTILGSCVAIVLWHPRKKLVGMCHYVMPDMHEKADKSIPGRYAKGAVRLLLESIKKHHTSIKEFEIGIYGGGCLFCNDYQENLDIGKKNIAIAQQLLSQLGVKPKQQKVGGRCYRTVAINGLTGAITLFESDTKPK